MDKFWHEQTRTNNEGIETTTFTIFESDILAFLNANGFMLIKNRKRKDYIRVVKNIVELIDEEEVVVFLRNFVKEINPDKIGDEFKYKKLYNTVLASRKLNENTFKSLERFTEKFMKDTPHTAYLFYKNGFTETTKHGTQLKPYESLQGKIWKEWTLDRVYVPTADRSDFERFIWQVATGELGEKEKDKRKRSDFETNENVLCFETTIGYLVHNYKNPSKAKAIIAFDDHEVEPDEPDGRTGKSLFCKVLSKIRKVVNFDGRNINLSYSHVFEKVKLGDQIMNFNDVTKYFEFDKLFHILTEGIDVNPKGKEGVEIDYQDSPKIYISTNYTVKGEGGSADARQHLLPFKPVYNSKFSPETFFGRLFFSDWDEIEWRKFDSYIHYCLQRFLTHGLKDTKSEAYRERRAMQGTQTQVIEFVRTLTLKRRYEKKTILDLFVAAEPDFKIKTSNQFWMWFTNACKYLELPINSHTSKGVDRDHDKIYYITIYPKGYVHQGTLI